MASNLDLAQLQRLSGAMRRLLNEEMRWIHLQVVCEVLAHVADKTLVPCSANALELQQALHQLHNKTLLSCYLTFQPVNAYNHID